MPFLTGHLRCGHFGQPGDSCHRQRQVRVDDADDDELHVQARKAGRSHDQVGAVDLGPA